MTSMREEIEYVLVKRPDWSFKKIEQRGADPLGKSYLKELREQAPLLQPGADFEVEEYRLPFIAYYLAKDKATEYVDAYYQLLHDMMTTGVLVNGHLIKMPSETAEDKAVKDANEAADWVARYHPGLVLDDTKNYDEDTRYGHLVWGNIRATTEAKYEVAYMTLRALAMATMETNNNTSYEETYYQFIRKWMRDGLSERTPAAPDRIVCVAVAETEPFRPKYEEHVWAAEDMHNGEMRLTDATISAHDLPANSDTPETVEFPNLTGDHKYNWSRDRAAVSDIKAGTITSAPGDALHEIHFETAKPTLTGFKDVDKLVASINAKINSGISRFYDAKHTADKSTIDLENGSFEFKADTLTAGRLFKEIGDDMQTLLSNFLLDDVTKAENEDKQEEDLFINTPPELLKISESFERIVTKYPELAINRRNIQKMAARGRDYLSTIEASDKGQEPVTIGPKVMRCLAMALAHTPSNNYPNNNYYVLLCGMLDRDVMPGGRYVAYTPEAEV